MELHFRGGHSPRPRRAGTPPGLARSGPPRPPPAPGTDPTLLLGVLALQADLISDAQCVEACAAWAARKDTPLADLLVGWGWLTAGDRADVDKLLQRKLTKHDGDARAGLAETTVEAV